MSMSFYENHSYGTRIAKSVLQKSSREFEAKNEIPVRNVPRGVTVPRSTMQRLHHHR
jgi:hypothetical protein